MVQLTAEVVSDITLVLEPVDAGHQQQSNSQNQRGQWMPRQRQCNPVPQVLGGGSPLCLSLTVNRQRAGITGFDLRWPEHLGTNRSQECGCQSGANQQTYKQADGNDRTRVMEFSKACDPEHAQTNDRGHRAANQSTHHPRECIGTCLIPRNFTCLLAQSSNQKEAVISPCPKKNHYDKDATGGEYPQVQAWKSSID